MSRGLGGVRRPGDRPRVCACEAEPERGGTIGRANLHSWTTQGGSFLAGWLYELDTIAVSVMFAEAGRGAVDLLSAQQRLGRASEPNHPRLIESCRHSSQHILGYLGVDDHAAVRKRWARLPGAGANQSCLKARGKPRRKSNSRVGGRIDINVYHHRGE
jgi:hypothetical protein